jgi:hypothetical protein
MLTIETQGPAFLIMLNYPASRRQSYPGSRLAPRTELNPGFTSSFDLTHIGDPTCTVEAGGFFSVIDKLGADQSQLARLCCETHQRRLPDLFSP